MILQWLIPAYAEGTVYRASCQLQGKYRAKLVSFAWVDGLTGTGSDRLVVINSSCITTLGGSQLIFPNKQTDLATFDHANFTLEAYGFVEYSVSVSGGAFLPSDFKRAILTLDLEKIVD